MKRKILGAILLLFGIWGSFNVVASLFTGYADYMLGSFGLFPFIFYVVVPALIGLLGLRVLGVLKQNKEGGK